MKFDRASIQGVGMTSQRTRDRMIARLRSSGITDDVVLSVMARIPRHLFIEEALAHRAYEEVALPLGYSQTISRPYTVAQMTEVVRRYARRCNEPLQVLEIGAGSGYQAAVLSELPEIAAVYTVERIGGLLSRARAVWSGLDLKNIHSRHVDGVEGWPEKAPFDVIIATCALPAVHRSWMQQLDVGGQLVAPVAQENGQRLLCLTRQEQGFGAEDLSAAEFVPFVQGLA